MSLLCTYLFPGLGSTSLKETACLELCDHLLRALKTKHDTPKYGLIYGASLVGQTAPKNKGRISRMLAAKASLCVRVDALGEDAGHNIGVNSRVLVENRLRLYEQDKVRKISGTGKVQARAEKYDMSR